MGSTDVTRRTVLGASGPRPARWRLWRCGPGLRGRAGRRPACVRARRDSPRRPAGALVEASAAPQDSGVWRAPVQGPFPLRDPRDAAAHRQGADGRQARRLPLGPGRYRPPQDRPAEHRVLQRPHHPGQRRRLLRWWRQQARRARPAVELRLRRRREPVGPHARLPPRSVLPDGLPARRRPSGDHQRQAGGRSDPERGRRGLRRRQARAGRPRAGCGCTRTCC